MRRRNVVAGMALILLSGQGCVKKKEFITGSDNRIPIPLPLDIGTPLVFQGDRCVYGLDDLLAVTGPGILPVRRVVLVDGTEIETGGTIASMAYQARPDPGSGSVFRSMFWVTSTAYGYAQTHEINCWSLGCLYGPSAAGEYTCLEKEGDILLVNTSLYWAFGPMAGRAIRRVVLE